MPKTVLAIDDEQDVLDLVKYNLEKQGYAVSTAADGVAGLTQARKSLPDLIVLDLMMPGMDGLEVCRAIRQDRKTQHIPVLMLTAKAEETDRVVGLEMGADDYLTKPFGVRELAARVKAVLRRSGSGALPDEVLKVGPLMIDTGRRKVQAGRADVELTATEFNILKSLAEHGGRVMTRDDLISEARGIDMMVSDRTIDVHVASLRRKLGKHGNVIETVRGVGYRIQSA